MADPVEAPLFLAVVRTLTHVFRLRGWTPVPVTEEEQKLWTAVSRAETKLSEPTLALRAWMRAVYDRHGVLCLCAAQPRRPIRPEVIVALPRERRLDIHTARSYVPVMQAHQLNHVVFVHAMAATPQAVQELAKVGMQCTRFLYEELAYFAPHSDYVAPHVRLSPAEAEAICNKYGRENLPVMKTTDPLAMLSGFRPGDVIRQRRSFQDTPQYVHYYLVQ